MTSIPAFRDLHLPAVVELFAHAQSGLFVFAGLTGSGRTTTVYSLAELVASETGRRVTIVGDVPLDSRSGNANSLITHRHFQSSPEAVRLMQEAAKDEAAVMVVDGLWMTHSFADAIKAAASGALVFLTLHANSAADALGNLREIVDIAGDETLLREFNTSLSAIVHQQLERSGDVRTAKAEVLIP